MTNTFKKGGRNFEVNILIIKQYVIIRVFPVCTGINRINNTPDHWTCRVPCTHRDKPEIQPLHLLKVTCSLYTQG